MAQDINLSPRNILGYMRDLEEKLPKRKYTEFDSGVIQDVKSEDDLNNAASLMMKFVGLDDYKPQCVFGKTDEGVGGYTCSARTDNIVPITVSEGFKGNKAAILAVLSHEICHKVLYANGIVYYKPFDVMNEVFADICTIYVGFGRLILNGYITTNIVSTSYLGYLKFNVYKDAYDIVNHILSFNDSPETEGWDCFLEEAFRMWYSDSDKRKLFLSSFADIQDEYSRLTRDINLLEQMVEQIKNGYSNILDKADECYFRRGEFFDLETKELVRPIAAFSAIYENIVAKDKQEELHEYDDIVTGAMLSLVDRCSEIRVDQLKYQTFTCPFCHTESTQIEYDNRTAIVKCPSCKKHFHLNAEHWNCSSELGRLRRKQNDINEQLIAQGRKTGESIGYKQGWENGRSEGIKTFISSLPKWLGWIVRKYNKVPSE